MIILVVKFVLTCSLPGNFLGIMVITRSVMILTVTLNAWFILLGVKFVMLGMSAKLTKSLGYGGTTTVKIKGGQHQGLTTNSLFSTLIGLMKIITD